MTVTRTSAIGFGLDLEVLDPVAALGIVGNEQLRPIAQEAKERLERAVQRLAER